MLNIPPIAGVWQNYAKRPTTSGVFSINVAVLVRLAAAAVDVDVVIVDVGVV